MKGKKRVAVLWIVVGFIGGVAAVMSCNNTALVLADQDMGGTCGAACTISGPITVSSVEQPVNVQVQQPVAVTASQPLPVSLSDPNPVPVSVSAPNPLPVSGTVAVSSIASPVSIAGPVDVNVQAQSLTVTQPVKTITADTDKNQLQSGQFGSNTPVKGPLVLTDVIGSGGFQIQVGTGSTCPPTTVSFTTTSQPATSGMRIFIPSGSVGCLTSGGGQTAWMGFIPY